MARKITYVIFIFCLLYHYFQSIAFAQNKILPANKIAFLRNQSIWLANTDGSAEQRITNKSSKIDEFLFSPSLRYLAYSKIIKSSEDRNICSIVVLDLKTNRIVNQTDSEFVYILKWLPQDKLLYYNSDEYAIGDEFVYNPNIDTVLKNYDHLLSEADFSRDEQLEAYAGSYGSNLCLHYNKTNRDTVMIFGKHNICDVRISNNKKYISFVQVLDLKNDKYDDLLWLYNLNTSSSKLLDRGPSHHKFWGVNYLGWSPDDRFIAMFFPPEAIVLEVNHPSKKITISGKKFCWLSNEEIIFTRNNDTYCYNLKTEETKVLIKNSDMAIFLH